MIILSKVFLVLGVALISYGVARWQIVPEILSKQGTHFDQFFATHAAASTNTLQDVFQLRKRVLMSGGLYPGWPQAIVPFALGLMLLAASYYFGQKTKGVTHEPVA